MTQLREGRRNHQLDLLRILFAIAVLLSHAPEMLDGNPSRELLNRLTQRSMTFGAFGVDGFFLLSGFLIVQSWDRDPELLNFLRKRVLRIVPGYLMAVVLSVLVVGTLAPGVPHFFASLDRRALVSVLLLGAPLTPPALPGIHPPMVNGSLWSITYEFRCYLMVGLLGIAGLIRRRTLWLAATALLLLLASTKPLEAHFEWSNYKLITGEPSHLYWLGAVFLVGGCFYLYRDRIRFRPAYASLAGSLLVAAYVLRPFHAEPVLILCGGYLLFYFAQLHLRALAFMRRVPDISYGIYLYGWPVEGLWTFYRHGSPWVTFAVSTFLCAILGWLSWHLVERPMLKLKRRPTAPLPPP